MAQDVGSPGKGLRLALQDQVDDGKCTAMIIPLGSAYLPKSHAPVEGSRALILLVDVGCAAHSGLGGDRSIRCLGLV